MDYRPNLLVDFDLTRYVEANHRNDRIYALWPLGTDLRFPYLGYVHQPLRVTARPASGSDFDVAVLTDFSELQQRPTQVKEIQENGFVLEKTFEWDDKKEEVWVRPSLAHH
jgi:hypothetical protein